MLTDQVTCQKDASTPLPSPRHLGQMRSLQWSPRLDGYTVFSRTSGVHDMNSPQCCDTPTLCLCPGFRQCLVLSSETRFHLFQTVLKIDMQLRTLNFSVPVLGLQVYPLCQASSTLGIKEGFMYARQAKLSTNRTLSPALGLGFGYKLYPVKSLSRTL